MRSKLILSLIGALLQTLSAVSPASALACGGFGVTDEIDSDKFTSYFGTVDRITVFGHGPNSGQTIFWIKSGRSEKQFRLSVANEGTVAAMATMLESSRQKGTKVEVCYCDSATTLPKVVSVTAGYGFRLCPP